MSSTILHADGTLDVPALLALHEATFGSFRMEDGEGDGEGTKDDGDEPAADADKDSETPSEEAKALTAERSGRKTAETVLSELTGKSKAEIRRLLKDGADSAVESLRPAEDASGKDKPDVDEAKIRRDAEKDADAKANARIIKSEVKALAAELFADPADAHLYLDLSKYEVDGDGEVDAKEITSDLQAILKTKPHLAKSSRPKPDLSQGKQGGKADATPGLGRMRQAYAASAPK